MPKVFLGMSGGVDSSVSAILLKEQGYDVTGIYMKNWSEDLPGMKCPWAEDLADAKRVAVQLDLDFEVWDFQQEYKAKVVDYMLAEFKKGRTPNPDVMCNEQIKFKLFYERALLAGADFIATGHYARVGQLAGELGLHSHRETIRSATSEGEAARARNDGPRERRVSGESVAPTRLLRARDENKDQTYFLYRMSDAATSRTLFPIGDLTKPAVKALAAERGLDVATKKESMGVCFVGEVGMKDFLREYIDLKPGEIRVAETDEIIGYHDGAIFYTIGQRHGLYLGGGLPYYVVQKDLDRNIVYVSRNLNHPALWSDSLTLEDLHLRNGLTTNDLAQIPNLKVRLRHRAPLLNITISRDANDTNRYGSIASPFRESPEDQTAVGIGSAVKQSLLQETKRASKLDAMSDGPVKTGAGTGLAQEQIVRLAFSKPIKRPASGQSAVLYSSEICLGGGIIA